MKRRSSDEMNKFFMADMKNYHSSDAPITVKSICWAIVASIALSVIYSKMDDDKLAHLSEQKSRFTQCASVDHEY
jgi:hypothetical protein